MLAVATVASVTLSGCAPGPDENASAEYSNYYPQISINVETGKITRYVNPMQDTTVFDEGYSDADMTIVVSAWATATSTYSIRSLVQIDGKPYPATTTLFFTADEFNHVTEQIEWYNTHIATPGMETSSLYGQVGSYWLRDANDALDTAEDSLSEVSYSVTGRTITEADQRVIDGWNQGLPAWVVQEQIAGVKVSSPDYQYAFTCATYEVSLSDETKLKLVEEVQAVVGDLVQVRLSGATQSINVQTSTPCKVVPTQQDNVGGSESGNSASGSDASWPGWAN